MQRPALNLTPVERSHLKYLIQLCALTEALDFLRHVAAQRFIEQRIRLTDDDLLAYLKAWQKILDFEAETKAG